MPLVNFFIHRYLSGEWFSYHKPTDFGEGNQLGSSLAGLIDEVDCLLYTCLEIEPLVRAGEQ